MCLFSSGAVKLITIWMRDLTQLISISFRKMLKPSKFICIVIISSAATDSVCDYARMSDRENKIFWMTQSNKTSQWSVFNQLKYESSQSRRSRWLNMATHACTHSEKRCYFYNALYKHIYFSWIVSIADWAANDCFCPQRSPEIRFTLWRILLCILSLWHKI